MVTFAIILIVIMCLFFNNKLNRINQKLRSEIRSAKDVEKTTKYTYTPLLECQNNYYPDKQYFDYTGDKSVYGKAIKDESVIRLVEINEKLVYNPVSIAQYGLDQYSNYIEYGDKNYFNIALLQAEYL